MALHWLLFPQETKSIKPSFAAFTPRFLITTWHNGCRQTSIVLWPPGQMSCSTPNRHYGPWRAFARDISLVSLLPNCYAWHFFFPHLPNKPKNFFISQLKPILIQTDFPNGMEIVWKKKLLKKIHKFLFKIFFLYLSKSSSSSPFFLPFLYLLVSIYLLLFFVLS